MKAPLFIILLAASGLAGAQGAPRAAVECKATAKKLVYDCRIALTRAGAPLEGVEVTLGADMPSMPMAHNVKPVKAAPAGAPGAYAAQLELEMLGEWALKLRLAGPVRDQLVEHLEFDAQGSKPAKPGGGHKHHRH